MGILLQNAVLYFTEDSANDADHNYDDDNE